MATGAAIIGGLSLAYGIYAGESQAREQRKAQQRQEQAIAEAERKQQEADTLAETRRLESLAAKKSGTNERIGRFDFDIDSPAARRAGAMPATQAAGQTLGIDDEDMNPFYARGL